MAMAKMNDYQREILSSYLSTVISGAGCMSLSNLKKSLRELAYSNTGIESNPANKFILIALSSIDNGRWAYKSKIFDGLMKCSKFRIITSKSSLSREVEGDLIVETILSHLRQENLIEEDGSKFRIKSK